MSYTKTFAERELDILVKSSEKNNRPVVEEFIPEILALCEKFGNSGQSGGSAPYVASAISQTIQKLCLQKPICPIMGIEEEWINVTENSMEGELYQNNRCSALFKLGNGKCYYLDAIVWVNQKGHGWSGYGYLPDGSRIRSRQYVKSFPFEPKTFKIDVIEKEVAKDDWCFFIKDEKQLEEVFKYYDKYIENETD